MLELSIQDPLAVSKICHALSTPLRLNILKLLENGTMSCLELSKQLGYPLSTISANVKILEEAGLIMTELLPAKNGSKKLCSLIYLDIAIRLCTKAAPVQSRRTFETQVPIGNYMNFEVSPSCGYVGRDMDVTDFDNPNAFVHPDRLKAQLLWFRKGFVEYRIPLESSIQSTNEISRLSFELELCSEAPGYNQKWKSDITVWVNGTEIGTFLSPADFGDRKGKFTPDFWELGSTQYGLFTRFTIDASGSYVNDVAMSEVCLKDLHLEEKNDITLRIGVKDTSQHIGGVNLFGKGFGDYDEDIKMIIEYT